MNDKIFAAPVSSGHGNSRWAWVTGASLVVIAGLAMAAGGHAMPLLPRSFSILGALAAFGRLVTAVVLLGQSRAAGDPAKARLGAGYVVLVAAAIPLLLRFPAYLAFNPPADGPAGGFFLWCFATLGFALCAGAYAVWHGEVAWMARMKQAAPQLPTICVAAIVYVCAGAWIIGRSLPLLSAVRAGDRWAEAVTIGVLPALLLANAAALAMVVRRLGSSNTLAAWLAVTLLASCLHMVLVLHAGGRAGIEWFAGALVSAVAASLMPLALVSELSARFNRIVALNVELLCTAYHDYLTQLPNRPYFLQSLNDVLVVAQRRQCFDYAVMFIDLNKFKQVNDSFGHAIGDLLLVEVGKRLKSCLRPQDTLARMGGDEFAVLLTGIADPQDSIAIAHRIAEAVRRPLRLQGHEILPSCSIGLVQGSDHYDTPEALLRDADGAMYQSKRRRTADVTTSPTLYMTSKARADLHVQL